MRFSQPFVYVCVYVCGTYIRRDKKKKVISLNILFFPCFLDIILRALHTPPQIVFIKHALTFSESQPVLKSGENDVHSPIHAQFFFCATSNFAQVNLNTDIHKPSYSCIYVVCATSEVIRNEEIISRHFTTVLVGSLRCVHDSGEYAFRPHGWRNDARMKDTVRDHQQLGYLPLQKFHCYTLTSAQNSVLP